MKKKAFTLIELLVVIAIIAILAAILFPVFAQAKLAAKETSGLSNTKQMGLATLMYVNDYDDTFPLAGVLRPAGGLLGMGVAAPYPYNDGEITGGNTVWQGAARQSMAASYAANAVQPYIKSLVLESLTGLTTWQNPVDTFGGTGFVSPAVSELTFNGDLHHYSTTAVVESSVTPMWWPGLGSDNVLGTAVAEPALNCANSIDDCMFNPGAPPTSSGKYLEGSTSPGDILFYNSDPNDTPYPYSNGRGPIVRCDGSAKSYNLQPPTYPQYLNANGAWLMPYALLYTPTQSLGLGIPSPGAWIGSYYTCIDGATVGTTQPIIDQYSCFFRPDRTK